MNKLAIVYWSGTGNTEAMANFRFTQPAADVAASPTQLPVLGTVTFSEWEG